MTIVRIAQAKPQPGWLPDGSDLMHFIVLVDDTGRRAMPLWLGVPDAKTLWHLLDRPAGEAPMAGGLQETAARLLHAAGVRVTAVDIEPASDDVPALRLDTAGARVWLATAAGTRQATVTAKYGLVLAAAAGAPVRVADEVMERLAVPVQGEDVLASFPPHAVARPLGRPGLRRRFEPRNMTFTDGLDYWELAGSFLAAGQSHWQDYSCTAAGRTAVLAAAVPAPAGFAVVVQTIDADDYAGRAVTFRGQLRATGPAGHAGLHLAAGRAVDLPGAHLRGGGSSPTGPGSSDWTWHEVTMPVPEQAGVIRFGISLTGPGRVELCHAELSPARPGTRE